MMQEFDDDFFFEEDKIKPDGNNSKTKDQSKVLVVLENETPKSVEFGTPLNENDSQQEEKGMTVTSGSVTLRKDEKNLIGISIGGGAPLCPCLYIVQIFEGSPAGRSGALESGDELVGVGGCSVRGKTKQEVARMIQAAKDEVTINYNKLHADPKQGKSLDILMKKMKHRLVESVPGGAADALGLSRAILCNDQLVLKLKGLRAAEGQYRRLVELAKRMLKAYFEVLQSYLALGDTLSMAGAREPQPRASSALSRLGRCHRALEADGIKMLKAVKPILADMGTYLNKAIPDTKLTIRKYAATKFEYLSYCLKVKEMDDEEAACAAMQEPLYRVETGNYEYRLILRCRASSRAVFARSRSDVLVKLELLDMRRATDLARALARLVARLAAHHRETAEQLKQHSSLFPVEVDLEKDAFRYRAAEQNLQNEQDEDEQIEYGKEIQEHYDIRAPREQKHENSQDENEKNESDQLLPGLMDEKLDEKMDNLTLLTELGLADTNTDLTEFGDFQNGMEGFLSKDNKSENDNDNDDVFDKLMSELSMDGN